MANGVEIVGFTNDVQFSCKECAANLEPPRMPLFPSEIEGRKVMCYFCKKRLKVSTGDC